MTHVGADPRSSTGRAADPSARHGLEPPLSPDGIPEFFLGIAAIDLAHGQSRMEWSTGPRLSWDGQVVAVGTLGVLFDNILAYPMIDGAPLASSLVSTEITIDALRRIPVDAGTLTARGRLLGRTADTAFASAELRTPDGEVLAVATQRGRYVPSGEPPGYDYARVTPATSDSLADLMWPDHGAPQLGADGRASLFVDARLGNHMHAMHGGVSLLFAEWAAVQAVRARGSELEAASVRIAYARPIPIGSTATFETTVEHLGRTSANVHVVGRTEAGKSAVVAAVTLH